LHHHGLGMCPYPVALRQTVLSSLSSREGGEEGEEGVATTGGEDGVAAAVEDDDNEPVKVILVLESPPRMVYKQTAWIRIGRRGRRTRTLEPRFGAREAGHGSPETGSEVWPPPPPPPSSVIRITTMPPPPSSGASSTTPPPQDPTAATESPPL
jgi:hypothetical protein